MSVWETGVLFCCTAVCLLSYGLTVTGFILADQAGRFIASQGQAKQPAVRAGEIGVAIFQSQT